MMISNKDADQWKAEGNELCRAKKFYQAIEHYDEALKRTTNENDALVLILNRCHARVSSQHFDSALQDAAAVLKMSPCNEKAMYRTAKALYGLRCFKESAAQFSKTIKLFPKNHEAARDLKRCKQRVDEEHGCFDFAAMLDEAIVKSPNPDMDRADYIGSINIQPCNIKSHGRGVFSTESIKAGELLLVEKAFSSSLGNPSSPGGQYDKTTGLHGPRSLSEMRADLATSTFLKLHRNPSMIPAFADLYSGPEAIEERDVNGNITVDDAMVQHRLIYNAFAFNILSRNCEWRTTCEGSAPASKAEEETSAIGIWLKASYINHSCSPTVRRSFIGDVMVWRAQADIIANTELKFGYISGKEDYAGRQKALSNYGFSCRCQICLSEKKTPSAKVLERDMIMLEIVRCFEASTPIDLELYFSLLDKMQSTYVFSPLREPRRHLIVPISNLLGICKSKNMLGPLMRLGITLLKGLGFELDVNLCQWRVKTWGYMCDEVISALADLWQSCGTLQPGLCEGLGRDVKIAYTIMAGEVESFEGAYGSARPGKTHGKGGDERHTRASDLS